MGWFTDMVWGTSPVIKQRQAEGYHLLYVDAASGAGLNVPAHSTMLLKIAPVEQPGAAFALAPPDGSPAAYFHVDDLVNLHVSSNGATFFGFGATASLASSVAASVDRRLAGWTVELALKSGELVRATKVSGPPPEYELLRLRSRLMQAGRM